MFLTLLSTRIVKEQCRQFHWPANIRPLRVFYTQSVIFSCLVEITGLEPVTSAVQGRRSPN